MECAASAAQDAVDEVTREPGRECISWRRDDGGIGRHSRLKICRSKERPGSTPGRPSYSPAHAPTSENRSRRIPSFARDERGVAILELALIAPFLILLAIGIIEIGLYTRVAIEVGNAARAGVQFGAQSPSLSTNAPAIISAATADANEVATLTVTTATFCSCAKGSGIQVNMCSPTPSCGSKDHIDHFVTVTASKQFTPLIAIVGLPSSMTISRTASQELSP